MFWAVSQLYAPHIRDINRIGTSKNKQHILLFQNTIILLGFIPIRVRSVRLDHTLPIPTPDARLPLTEPAARFVTAGTRF